MSNTKHRKNYVLKPVLKERMRELLKDEKDFDAFEKIIHERQRSFIRCNTLKISSSDLFKRLNEKWKVKQPFFRNPEVMVVENKLEPGELGNALEHLLGYYYVQEVSSMLSVIALQPKPGDFVLDLTAAPGSKTTQIAAAMENKGTLIANDKDLGRVRVLAANLERCGVMNCVVTRNDGVVLCDKMNKAGYKFDKVLVDTSCSGEGTFRSSPKTFMMWNIKQVKNLSRIQKRMLSAAFKVLKKDGELVYSTCTHAPEENEAVVDFALKNFPVEVEKITLPLKCRSGIKEWKDKEYDINVEKTCRIYPQDNDSEGFFVAKFKLKEEIKGEMK